MLERWPGEEQGGACRRRSSHLRIALALTALALAGGCRREQRVPLAGAGVLLTRATAPGAAARPEVQQWYGDWILASDRLRLVVSDKGLARAPSGALVDLQLAGGGAEHLLELTPLLRSNEVEIPLRVREITGELRHGRPVIRIERRSADHLVDVSTEISVLAGQERVDVHHRLHNRSRSQLVGLRFGLRTRWALGPAFVPGVGIARTPIRRAAPFVAWHADGLAYAVALAGEASEVFCRFEPHGPLDQLQVGTSFALSPGQSRDERAQLLVVRGGIARAATLAWEGLGIPLGRVTGMLPRAALPARVEAAPADEITGAITGTGSATVPPTPVSGPASGPVSGPVSVTDVAPDGRFELSLPAGNYRLVARTPGGDDVQPMTVERGVATEVSGLVPPRPGNLRFDVRDEAGRALPARLVIRGVPPTRDPKLGDVHVAAGAGNIVYSADGLGEIPLPDGEYEVLATHGLEYEIDERRVRVARGRGSSVRFRLIRSVDSMGWLSAEMHLHASPSHDSQISLRDRVTSLLAEGVEVAVATDHNHVTDYRPEVEALGAGRLLAPIVGVEVTTWQPHLGHFNVFPYPPDAPPPAFAALAPAELFARMRERAPDAVIQVNHPRMGQIGYFNQAALDPSLGTGAPGYAPGFDAVELLNGMDIGKPDLLARNLDDWFRLLNAGLRYTATGNSDSHQLIYQWTGYPRTYLQLDDDRPEAVTGEQIAATLRRGQAFVTTGPFLVVRANGAGPGQTAAASDGRVHLQIAVRAPRWVDVRTVEVVVNGKLTLTESLPARSTRVDRLLTTRELSIQRDAWLVVIARGERTLDRVLPFSKAIPVAFSNPIFLDRDGDGRFGTPAAAVPADASVEGGTPPPDGARIDGIGTTTP